MQVLAAGAAMFSVVCVALLIVGRNSIQSSPVTLLFLAVSIYLLGNYIEIAYHSMEATKVGLFVRFIIVPYIPTLWYFCVRRYCGLTFQHRWVPLLFLIVPTIFAYLCLSWESNHLLIADVYYQNSSGYGNPTIAYGPLYMVRNIYQLGINALGMVTIYNCRIKEAQHFKKQAVLFMVSVLIPLSNTMTYFTRVGSYYVDITPYTLLFATTLTLLLYFFSLINLTDIIRYSTIDNINEGILYFDKDGLYLGCNAAADTVLPMLKTVSVGTDIKNINALPVDLFLNEVDNADGIEFTVEYRGSLKTYTVSKSQIRRGTKVIGYSLIITNITNMKKLLTDMEEKSKRDSLTGLYNKGFLIDYGQALLEDACRSNTSMALVMMDIDYFKNVNDSYGHPYGDYVLQEIANLCKSAFRKSDMIVRYGGEEFCILMPDILHDAARRKAEQVRKIIEQHPFSHEGTDIFLTVSMGLSFNRFPTDTMDELIKRADECLYISKHDGRNKVT